MFEFIRLNLAAFLSKEDAVSSLEYAILAVVVLGAIVAILAGNTGSIRTLFTNMSSTIASAAGS